MPTPTTDPERVTVRVHWDGAFYRASGGGRRGMCTFGPESAAVACAARVLECSERQIAVVAAITGVADRDPEYVCYRRDR